MKDFYVNFAERGPLYDEVDTRELETLDKTSPTSVVDFIRLFANDRSFAPPESTMVFDSDFGDISIDDDESKSLSYDFEDAHEDEQELNNARAQD